MPAAVMVPLMTSLASSLISGAVGKMFNKGSDSNSQAPSIPAAPQQAKAADSALFTAQDRSRATAQGQASTLLTGAKGVSNNELNLGGTSIFGRNTALGE